MIDDLLARCRFPAPGTAVDCAVSGGPDSLALLILASRAGCAVTAIHVDHGLRPDSAAEADVVAAAADRFGASFRAERVVVAPGSNLEARAREARYAALPTGVLTGHTADDRAETVLVNLLRGASIDGLAGIRPSACRPLLDLRRTETVALCSSLALQPVADPSNEDARFVRNRIRHELLPLLDDIAQRDVVPLLCRTADLTGDAALLLDQLAAEVDPTDARALASAPVVLGRAAVRRWLRQAGWSHPPDSAAVDRVLAVAAGEARATDVGDGWRVTRSAQRLSLDPPR